MADAPKIPTRRGSRERVETGLSESVKMTIGFIVFLVAISTVSMVLLGLRDSEPVERSRPVVTEPNHRVCPVDTEGMQENRIEAKLDCLLRERDMEVVHDQD